MPAAASRGTLNIACPVLARARLAGVLGLDRLCEDGVSALAAAAALHAPAPAGSAAGRKQVAALAALVGLGSCPEAGLLGGGWVVILRALSALEALQVLLSSSAVWCSRDQVLQMWEPRWVVCFALAASGASACALQLGDGGATSLISYGGHNQEILQHW